ncbi:hypothetical protein QFZ82_007624 [Streptomyces sp. V4I23]|uniref:hypothetical protein n=1 Tax=Streptomyces sp. V4I23 TaxID=3042282 RepID=UPI00277DC0EF|nr:hypothetical protein [Streptomyces sp. V4I23]MDQ1013139.1 hypothetical protein [Streptomyces sp. V4I23]
MTPRRRRSVGGRGRRAQRNEAARLTDQLIAEGFSKKQVGEILGRNPSLVSQFFTKNKGASFVEALRAVVQEGPGRRPARYGEPEGPGRGTCAAAPEP